MKRVCECGCGLFTSSPLTRFILNHHQKTLKGDRNPSKRKEVIEKISKKMVGNKNGNGNKGQIRSKLSENHKNNISNSLKGITKKEFTSQHLTNLSLSHLGQVSWLKGKHHSIETKKKLSEIGKKNPSRGMLGKTHSQNTKDKLRIRLIEQLKYQPNSFIPTTGILEKEFFDEISLKIPYKIERQEIVDFYFVDGYIKEKNIVIEFDEKFHYNLNGDLSRADIIRQNYIQNKLNCSVIRIKDKDWIENKEEVMKKLQIGIS
jgi:very-short-patch-repair endonuclease